MRQIAIFTFLALASLTGWAKPKVVVWEHPAAEQNTETEGFFGTLLEVTRVELADDETRLMLHVSLRPEYNVKFSSGAHLVAEGKTYALRSLDGMELDQKTKLTEKGYADLVFHFEPLPKETERFDFTEGDEGGGFRILGIEDMPVCARRMFPSLWRNSATGDWDIAFYDDFAIYQCRFWQYLRHEQRGDTYALTLESDGQQVDVLVGKNRKGHRTITIDGTKADCTPITSICLPDYPAKDTCTAFRDTHYEPDTATLVGWLKDMPQGLRERGNEYHVSYYDLFTGDQKESYGKLDSLGRFTIRVPLLNTSEVGFDFEHTFIRMPFEPGETYFLLYDYLGGHKLMMGRNCRVQNEILASPIQWTDGQAERGMDAEASMKFLDETRGRRLKAMDRLMETLAARPNTSARYVSYLTGYYRAVEAEALMQARYRAKDYGLPAPYLSYVGEQHWQQRARPYTLYRDFPTFRHDYLEQLELERFATRVDGGYIYDTYLMVEPILRRYRDAGKLSLTDEELALIDRCSREQKVALAQDLANDNNEALTALYEQDHMKQYAVLGSREDIKEVISGEAALMDVYMKLSVLDSVGCDPDLRDIIITNELLSRLDHDRTPLTDAAISYFDAHVQMPAARDALHQKQDKYLALSRHDISGSASIRSADDVAGMSDGEQLLRKLTEPYRGQIILLDVWGTWCGPCKAALAKSHEEYERLEDYDLVYLYLCNNSTDESWAAVIKEYDLTGDDIVHYNLPAAQQSAIEHFLGVRAYPTYKLIDREGNVLDVNADPRDLEALARLLDQLQ